MKIRITPGAVLLLAVLLVQRNELLLATVLAASWHECGHLLAARVLGIRLRCLELDMLGARLFPAVQIPSYAAEGLLAAAGPAASVLLALLPLPAPFGTALRTATLSFALFNALPIEGFDGGRFLHAILASRISDRTAKGILLFSSYLSLLLLFSLSACLLLRYGDDASLAVLSASLFARIFLTLRTVVQTPFPKRSKSEHLREKTRI